MTDVDLRPDALNCISLCTGGGGLDLGVELAIPCARPVLYVEREAFACGHLVEAIEQGHLAPAPVWTDARTVPGRRFRGLVDFVFGGIPCQPHSVAGKQLGEEDERDLWSPTRRLIVQSGAWVVLIENVGGMLSTGGAYRVWRDLRRLGFEVEGGLFTAEEVGAPHQRERIFLLGVADRHGPRQHRGSERDGLALGPPVKAPWRHDADGRYLDVANADFALVQGQPPAGQFGEHESHAGDGGGPEGVGQADALSLRPQGIGANPRALGRQAARRPAGLRGGADLEHAARIGRREGRPEPELRSWGRAAGEPVGAVGDADCRDFRGGPDLAFGSAEGRTAADWAGRAPPFPPGPRDIDAWRAVLERWPEVEPAVRGVADGLAAGLDAALLDRIDRLRLLGNGVVSLVAGYALRTLATRLAARSAGAAELVRLMEEA